MKTFFVSSTFRDMNEERDAIQQITLPSLNAVARTYGESVSFCDLRWGVDTTALETDEGSRKVLDVCLDEIDRCKPPMIVILGERYGWLPPKELIGEAARIRQLNLESLEMSVTALEIEYGALNQAARTDTLFYFREIYGNVPEGYGPEDEKHTRLLQALKARIVSLSAGRVKTYQVHWDGQGFQGVDRFAEMLAEDLAGLMRPQWEAIQNLTPQEREQRTHWAYVREKAEMFRARRAFARELLARIRGGETSIVLQDRPGSGKSTFFSWLALALQEAGFSVLPLSCGLTVETSTAFDVLKKIVRFLEDALGLTHPLETRGEDDSTPTEDAWKKRLQQLCDACQSREIPPIAVMIDGADQLSPDELRDNWDYVPKGLSSSLRLIVTCLDTLPVRGFAPLSFPPLESREKAEMVRAILEAHHRELSAQVVTAITAMPQSDNPLYVSLLIQRLLMMDKADFLHIHALGDGMEAITAHQLDILANCPRDLDGLCVHVLEIAGKRINPRLVSDASQFLAVSRRGLRIEDLKELLGADFNMLDFVHFVTYMSDSFIMRSDGRYDFSHQSIRKGFFRTCADPRAQHHRIMEHLLSLPEDDSVRISEVVYHMVQADAPAELTAYIEQNEYHEDNSIIRTAAATLFDCCLAAPSWLPALIRHAEDYGAGKNFLDFLVYEFRQCANGRKSQQMLALRVGDEALLLARRLLAAGVDVRKTYGRGISFFAGLAEETGRITKEELPRFYLKSLSIARELHAEDNSAKPLLFVAECCRSLANVYKGFGYSQAKKTLRCFEEAISAAEESLRQRRTRYCLLFLARCYEERADAFGLFPVTGNLYGNESSTLVSSLERQDQEKSIFYMERILEEYPEYDNRSAMFWRYAKCAILLGHRGGPKNRTNLERAREYAEKAYDIAGKLFSEIRNPDAALDLETQSWRLANILDALDRSTSHERVVALYQESLRLLQYVQAAEKERNVWDQIAGVWISLAKHWLKLDETTACAEKAIACLGSAIESAQKADPAEVREIFETSHNYLYDALMRCGREEDALAALEAGQLFVSTPELNRMYAEFLLLLQYIDDELVEMIPYTVLETFHDTADRQFKSQIDPSKELDEQVLLPETETLLSTFYINFWEDDIQENVRLFDLLNEDAQQEKYKAMSLEELNAEGERCLESSPYRAFTYFLAAAEKGDIYAQIRVARCYDQGIGADRDFEETMAWLARAAKQGSCEAALELGSRLLECNFWKEGLPYLKQAAGTGSTEACRLLEAFYRQGMDVPADENEAAFWHAKAMKGGQEEGQ